MRFIFVCFILLFSEARSQKICDRVSLVKCFESISFIQKNPFANSYDDSAIGQICGNLSSVKSCYSNNSSHCTIFDLSNFESNLNLVTYLCGDGKAGWGGMRTCLQSNVYMENFSNCTTSLAPLSRSMDWNVTGDYCKYNNALYSCYANASKTCNNQDFVTAAYKLSTGSTLKMYYGCDLDYKNWDTKVYSKCNFFIMSQCSSNAVSQELSQILSTPLSLFSMNLELFNKSCSMVDEIYNCINKTAQCEDTNPVVLSILSGVKATQNLCRNDRSGYSALVKCYSNQTDQILPCLTMELSDCNSFKASYKCVTDKTKKLCGNSTTVENLLYQFFLPATNQIPNCQLSLPTTQKGTVNNGDRAFDRSRYLIMAFYMLLIFILVE